MARTPSKIMTVADKKAAMGLLNEAMKAHNANIKTIAVEQKAAAKALADAKKSADARAQAAEKAAAAERKVADAQLKAAQKTYDAAVAKAAKLAAAAEKGTAKLTGQIAALEAVPTEPAKRGPKAKVSAPETAAA
jgi:hypothetical protein